MIKISLTAFYIILIIKYIGFQIGLWGIFEKAGVKGWKSVIPIYRSWIWLRQILDRPCELQHTGLPCPSLPLRVCSDSCQLSG